MDLHAAQIQGFFDIPVDHLFAAPVIIDYVQQLKLPDLTVVSPDAGGVERARAYAKRLDASLAIVDKRRDQPNVAEVHNVIGDVAGRTALIVDDIVDTARHAGQGGRGHQGGGRARGARLAAPTPCSPATRSRRSRRARSPSSSSPTRSRSGPEKRGNGRIVVLSIAELMAKAIKNIHEETSVTSLFV